MLKSLAVYNWQSVHSLLNDLKNVDVHVTGFKIHLSFYEWGV